MSIYFSRFGLNTYRQTSYFQAHLPVGYPDGLILQKCKAFRRLPPNLKKLSALAKRWAERKNRNIPSQDVWKIADYYDADGYELDPDTGRRLTLAEIDAQWERWQPPDIQVEDIPVPDGGFADPDTWEEPKREEVDGRGIPTTAQLLRDITSRGRKATAEEYGLTEEQLPGGPSTYEGMEWDEAKAHFSKRVANVLRSPYFLNAPAILSDHRNAERSVLMNVLRNVDLYDDFWGEAGEIFDRAEAEYLLSKFTEEMPKG